MELYDILDSLKIDYKKMEHDAVYTVEDVKNLNLDTDAEGCKNLFLTNHKGGYYLVVMLEDDKINLKEFSKKYDTGHLSFGSEEELQELLGITRGCCSPFAIINDKENKVKLFISRKLRGKKLMFHPNVNTASVAIMYDDLIKFIEHENNPYKMIV